MTELTAAAGPVMLRAPLSREGYPTGIGALLPGVHAELVRRAADAGAYDRWSRLVAGTGNCARPVRLSGTVHRVDEASGEIRSSYDSAAEPDGVLLVACRNRRAAVCPPCSETYRADTYQLIAAGLRGGKGLPETVAAHPRVFATLTAPSFGAGAHHPHRRRGPVPALPRPAGHRVLRARQAHLVLPAAPGR